MRVFVCACLTLTLGIMMLSVVWVGFLQNVYDNDHLAVLVVGGQDFEGRPLRNATIVDMDAAPLIPGCEKTPRSDLNDNIKATVDSTLSCEGWPLQRDERLNSHGSNLFPKQNSISNWTFRTYFSLFPVHSF